MLPSLPTLLKNGWQHYRDYFWLLTQPLVIPTLYIITGCAVWLYAPWWFKQYGCPLLHVDLISPIGLIGFMGMMLPGMWLFFRGFWQYLVWFCASNIVLASINTHGYTNQTQIQQAKLSVQSQAWDYSLLLLCYGAIAIVPFAGATLISILASLCGAPAVVNLGAAAVVFIILCMLVIPMFAGLSLLFQAFSLQPNSLLNTFIVSLKRFTQAPITASAIWILGIVLGSLIVPAVALGICQLFKLQYLLNIVVEPIMLPYAESLLQLMTTQQAAGSSLPAFDPEISLSTHSIALNVTEMIIQSVASVALLPLYNSWHTTLYCALMQQQPEP